VESWSFTETNNAFGFGSLKAGFFLASNILGIWNQSWDAFGIMKLDANHKELRFQWLYPVAPRLDLLERSQQNERNIIYRWWIFPMITSGS
jgi:hypothetical protein